MKQLDLVYIPKYLLQKHNITNNCRVNARVIYGEDKMKRPRWKVIGIDVKHPKDYQKNWPFKKSEGLLIVKDTYYRTLHDGTKEKI